MLRLGMRNRSIFNLGREASCMRAFCHQDEAKHFSASLTTQVRWKENSLPSFCNFKQKQYFISYNELRSCLINSNVDLPQVDLMNFRVEYVRPRSGRFSGREAGKRATKLREVDLSRLKGFHLRFVPKMRDGVTSNWSDDIWKLNFPLRPKQYRMTRMCVRFSYCVKRANSICLLCTNKSDYEQRF